MSIRTPTNVFDSNIGRGSTTPLVTIFETRAPTAQDINYLQGQRWIFENPALSAAITAIPNSASGGPTTVTATNVFLPGSLVTITGVGGMTQINNGTYQIIDVTTSYFVINVDSSTWGAYTSGGTAVVSQSMEYILESVTTQGGYATANWTLLAVEPEEPELYLEGNDNIAVPYNDQGVWFVKGDGTYITTVGTIATNTLEIEYIGGSLVESITAIAPLTANGVSGTPETGPVTIALTTPLALNYGGTNANLTANDGGIFYSTATAGAILSGTATARQMLQSGASTAPAWSTATWPATTTINQILYSSANNVVGGITASDNGVLISGTTGIPSWLAAGTTGQVLSATTSMPASWETLSSIAVTSITGTANEILANGVTTPQTGAVTLTIPTVFIAPGSIAATTSLATGMNGGTGGTVLLNGSTSGTITIQPQAAAGTFNFNLPITAGTSGYLLTSAGGGGSPMTWTDPSSFTTTFAGDTGTPFATNSVVIQTNNAGNACGSSVLFNASTPDITLQVTDNNNNTIIGKLAGTAGISGTDNTILGHRNAVALGTGSQNVSIGKFTGFSLTSGSQNTLVGYQAGSGISTSSCNTFVGNNCGEQGNPSSCVGVGYNVLTSGSAPNSIVAVGYEVMQSTTGNNSTGVGYQALNALTTGQDNIALGYEAGKTYITESSNLVIGHIGVGADANTIRIGTQGSGSGQQNKTYIAGIAGATVSAGSPTFGAVIIDTSDGQLLSATSGISNSGYVLTSQGTSSPPIWTNITAEGAITTIDVDLSGSVTGGTISLFANSGSANAGASVLFVAASGTEIDLQLTDSSNNTTLGGGSSGTANDTCLGHNAIGYGASVVIGGDLATQSGDINNVALGQGGNTGGSSYNVSIGQGFTCVAGSTYNVAIGQGISLSAVNNSVCLGAGMAVAATYNSISIGYGLNISSAASIILGGNASYPGGYNNSTVIGFIGGPSSQTSCYIDGIAGASATAGSPTFGAVIIDTSDGQLLSATTGISTAGFVLTSNGTATAPTWQAASGGFSSINVQTFTTSGTYTPTSGMLYCTIEVVGAGGGGGGAPEAFDAAGSAGGGGGAGGYSRITVAAATIGASQSVTIGSGGGGGGGSSSGSAGGTSSVGSIISATGGSGGTGGSSSSTSFRPTAGGSGGTGSSGNLNTNGAPGATGFGYENSGDGGGGLSGTGGSSIFGGGGIAVGAVVGGSSNGNNGSNYGSGGSGAASSFGAGSVTGGTGSGGIVIITEYI